MCPSFLIIFNFVEEFVPIEFIELLFCEKEDDSDKLEHGDDRRDQCETEDDIEKSLPWLIEIELMKSDSSCE